MSLKRVKSRGGAARGRWCAQRQMVRAGQAAGRVAGSTGWRGQLELTAPAPFGACVRGLYKQPQSALLSGMLPPSDAHEVLVDLKRLDATLVERASHCHSECFVSFGRAEKLGPLDQVIHVVRLCVYSKLVELLDQPNVVIRCLRTIPRCF